MTDEQRRSPALMALSVWARSLPGGAAAMAAEADITQPHLYLHVRSAPGELSRVRARLAGWACEMGASTERTSDVVLAADEAMSNAVEHAYHGSRGFVTVLAAPLWWRDVLQVIVADSGTWRPSGDKRGGGHGMSMMRKLADRFDLHHDDRGTAVVLRWPIS